MSGLRGTLRRRGFRLLLAIVAATVPAAAEPCSFPVHVDIPVTRSGDDLLVDATVDGVPLKLKVHIGSTVSILFPPTLERVGVRGWRADRNIGATISDGSSRKPLKMVKLGKTYEYDIGPLRYTRADLFVAQLPPSMTEGADGLMGWDALSGLDVDLEVKAGRIGVYKPKGDCETPSAALPGDLTSVAFYRRDETNGQPRFKVTMGGREYEAALSTTTTASVIRRSTAAELNLPSPSDAKKPVRLPALGIAALAISNLPATVEDSPSADVVLGLSFLAAVPVWISNSSQRLIFTAPP